MRRFLAGILVWGLVAFGWFCFAPPVLGGWTNYVVTDGISMEPHFHGGDLVLVRSEASYHVGEIVAYRSKALGTVVLHRIVGLDGSRYIFKGDNNNFDDVEHPTRSELIGAAWLHIPAKYADVLSSLREPPVLGGLVAFGALMLGAGAFRRRRRRKRERRLNDGQTSPSRGAHRAPRVVVNGDFLIFGAGLLLASAAVAAVAYTRPLVTHGPASIPYAQGGAFSYSSSTASGPAYPGGRVVTGDPVFIRLVQSVDVRFAYRFSTAAPHEIAGSASLVAKITSSSGWAKTLVLEPSTPFIGDHAVLAGRLTLGPLLAMLLRLERTTAVGGSYSLSLVPHVSISGQVAGVRTRARFSAPLPFTFGPLELQPILSSGASSSTQPATGSSGTVLSPSSTGSVIGTVQRPRALAFGPARISVATARWIAAGGLALGISLLLGALGFLARASRRGDMAGEILGRYRRGLVTVARAPRPSPSGLVEVELDDMETLVRIADRYDRMILHENMKGADTFSVPEDGVVYRFAVPSEILVKPPKQARFFGGRDAIPDRLEDMEAYFAAVVRRSRGREAPNVPARTEPGYMRWGPWTETKA